MIIAFALIAVAFLLDNFAFKIIPFIENPVLDYVSHLFVNLVSIAVIALIILVVILISKKKREWFLPFLISTTAAYFITYLIKFAFARPRPNSIEMGFILGFNDYSFPSTHAAVAFAMLPILIKEHPKQKWLWVTFALIIAFSRIYIGVHHLSDVTAGALIGYFTGMLVIKLKQRKWKLTNSR